MLKTIAIRQKDIVHRYVSSVKRSSITSLVDENLKFVQRRVFNHGQINYALIPKPSVIEAICTELVLRRSVMGIL